MKIANGQVSHTHHKTEIRIKRVSNMAEIILHPTHPDYCKECIYSNKNGSCSNNDYNKNSYQINCVWGYCKYKKLAKIKR